jgi:hypothetical protein
VTDYLRLFSDENVKTGQDRTMVKTRLERKIKEVLLLTDNLLVKGGGGEKQYVNECAKRAFGPVRALIIIVAANDELW